MLSKGLKVYGRHIVADPNVCHGKLVFRGTRVFVDDVLEQVAQGIAWESITDAWGGRITAPMIAEAIRLAQSPPISSDVCSGIPASAPVARGWGR